MFNLNNRLNTIVSTYSCRPEKGYTLPLVFKLAQGIIHGPGSLPNRLHAVRTGTPMTVLQLTEYTRIDSVE